MMKFSEVEFLSRLVRIDTNAQTKAGYTSCATLIEREGKKLGFKTRVYDAVKETPDKKPRPSVVVDLDVGAGNTILLVTHYDVVPPGVGWKHDPFKLTVERGKAFGRGATDDKGSIVAALGALHRIGARSRVNLSVVASPDEEVGGEFGIGYLLDHKYIEGDGAVILDASPEMVSLGASGVVWGIVTVKGKQGHAGYPHKMRNAIEAALPFLNDLKEYAKIREKVRSRILAPPGSPHKYIWGRFSLTILKAGEKENIIPGLCEARFDLRVCPDEDFGAARENLKEYFRKLVARHKIDATLELPNRQFSNYYTDARHPLVRNFQKAASTAAKKRLKICGELGSNDGHFFARKSIPVISFGTNRIECNFHGADEFVYLNDIKLVKETLLNFASSYA
jgi:succinyl-diaminopimelate desuccinylase